MPQRLVGYIDPTVMARNRSEQQLLDAMRERGFNLHRIHREGTALRISGSDLFLLLDDLGEVRLDELPTGR